MTKNEKQRINKQTYLTHWRAIKASHNFPTIPTETYWNFFESSFLCYVGKLPDCFSFEDLMKNLFVSCNASKLCKLHKYFFTSSFRQNSKLSSRVLEKLLKLQCLKKVKREIETLEHFRENLMLKKLNPRKLMKQSFKILLRNIELCKLNSRISGKGNCF